MATTLDRDSKKYLDVRSHQLHGPLSWNDLLYNLVEVNKKHVLRETQDILGVLTSGASSLHARWISLNMTAIFKKRILESSKCILSTLFRSIPDRHLFFHKSEQLQNVFETSGFSSCVADTYLL